MKIHREGSLKRKLRISQNLSLKPDIEIFYYPYYMNADFNTKDSEFLVLLSDKNLNIEVVESNSRPLSGFPSIVDIMITFASIQLLSGFINEIGSDVYKTIKQKLKKSFAGRKNDFGKEMQRGIHLCFETIINDMPCKIKLAFLLNDLEKPFTIESVLEYINSLSIEVPIVELLITRIDKAPYWKLVRGIDKKRNAYYLD